MKITNGFETLADHILGNDMCRVHSLLIYNHTPVMKMYVYLVIGLRIGLNTLFHLLTTCEHRINVTVVIRQSNLDTMGYNKNKQI